MRRLMRYVIADNGECDLTRPLLRAQELMPGISTGHY